MRHFANNRLVVTILWAICFALYFLVGKRLDWDWNVIFKLGPEIVLLAAVLISRGSRMACMALIFSMIGDMAGEVKFIPVQRELELQIAFFSIAHICYITDFIRHTDYAVKRTEFPYAAITGVSISAIYMAWAGYQIFSNIQTWPAVLKVCLVIYFLMLATLIVTAAQQKRRAKLIYLAGAMLFMFSDTLIGMRVFVGPVPHSRILIMSTYFIAQYLLNIPRIRQMRNESGFNK